MSRVRRGRLGAGSRPDRAQKRGNMSSDGPQDEVSGAANVRRPINTVRIGSLELSYSILARVAGSILLFFDLWSVAWRPSRLGDGL